MKSKGTAYREIVVLGVEGLLRIREGSGGIIAVHREMVCLGLKCLLRLREIRQARVATAH